MHQQSSSTHLASRLLFFPGLFIISGAALVHWPQAPGGRWRQPLMLSSEQTQTRFLALPERRYDHPDHTAPCVSHI